MTPTKTHRLRPGASAAFLLALSLLASSALCETAAKPARQQSEQDLVQPGVVLERFDSEFDGPKKMGMEPGDILLSWSRGSSSGKLESPFDLSQVLTEEMPRGVITFEGLHGSEKKSWTLAKPYWATIMRPNFSPAYLAVYDEGAKLAQMGKPLDAVKHWRSLAMEARRSQFAWLTSWILYRCAETLSSARLWKEADACYQDTVLQSAQLPPGVKAELLQAWGLSFDQRNDWDGARKYLELSMAESQKAGAGYLTQKNFTRLASVAEERGDLTEAAKLFQQSLESLEKLQPVSIYLASGFLNNGFISIELSNLSKADEYFGKALAIYRMEAPNTNGEAYIWADLAEIALQRSDLVKAEKCERRALTIEDRVDKGSLDHARVMSALASILDRRGNTREAEDLMEKSLSFIEKGDPGGIGEAEARESLGEIALHRGDLAAAEQSYRQALAVREKLAPEGIAIAQTLSGLGDIALKVGDMVEAEADHRRALSIREKLIPGSAYHAESLAAMAGIMRRTAHPESATSYYARAIAAFESQAARLGGSSEERAGFRGRHTGYYLDYIDLLVGHGDTGLAFDTLERWRARTLLEMLAASHVDIRQGVDPVLVQRERALLVDIKSKSARRINLITEKHSQEAANAVEKEISELTSEYQEVEGQIRSSSPAYAALTQPQPLHVKEIQQQLLDKDTLLLEYSLGEDRSYLFALSQDSLQVFPIPKRAEVEKAARSIYELLTERKRVVAGETPALQQERFSRADAAYPMAVAELGHMVLGPVATQIRNKRLLVVADGALQYIPFTILPEPSAADALMPLVVNHEIVNLPSASVFALLRQQQQNRHPAAKAVAVLADPVFTRQDPRVLRAVVSTRSAQISQGPEPGTPADDSSSDSLTNGPLTRSAADVGLGADGRLELPRLRYSRQEADAILAVTPPGSGLKAVDFQASRATATSPELSQYRIVHFATHGLINSEHPELSGLVLSLVDKTGKPQEGFLELQDIYNLNLPADLVVLSACETGLGKEISGEGLVGMTRGFMYAGASRVVASLWKVSDAATAQLMAEFYRAMEKDHLAPAAALRAAQVQMLKQKRWSSPYYWAAFQIQGEWK